MKIYFLVEGLSTEMKILPFWVRQVIPELTIFDSFSDYLSADDGVFFISGNGYPSILGHLRNSIFDIKKDERPTHFFIIIDADDEDVALRERLIEEEIAKLDLPPDLKVVKIINNRCFETILLGNKKVIPRQPNSPDLSEYIRYFNVVENDPESMGKHQENTHAQFHAKYLKKALLEKRIAYSKANPKDVQTEDYFNALVKRVNTTSHLASFKKFLDALNSIKSELEPSGA